jgi:hypothetical protein
MVNSEIYISLRSDTGGGSLKIATDFGVSIYDVGNVDAIRPVEVVDVSVTVTDTHLTATAGFTADAVLVASAESS